MFIDAHSFCQGDSSPVQPWQNTKNPCGCDTTVSVSLNKDKKRKYLLSAAGVFEKSDMK